MSFTSPGLRSGSPRSTFTLRRVRADSIIASVTSTTRSPSRPVAAGWPPGRRRTPCMPSTSSRRRKPVSTCCARSRWPRRSPTPCECCRRAAARASRSALPSTCASTRPMSARANSRRRDAGTHRARPGAVGVRRARPRRLAAAHAAHAVVGHAGANRGRVHDDGHRRALGRPAALRARRRGGRDHAVTDGQTVTRPLEQLACLTLRFGNGTLGQVVASRLLPDSRNDFRVYGITGLIAGHHSMWEARTGRFEITSDTVNETADYPEALLPNYVAEIEDFQRAVTTGGQPAATGLDGLRVVEVTLAMIESARTRRSVKIERVEP